MTVLWILITSTLRAATPLLLAALGGVMSERSGVVNIALEGIMLMGAFAAVAGAYYTNSAIVGLLSAAGAGILFSALHAVASIRYKANQVVSGVALNLLATGFTEFMLIRLWNSSQSPRVPTIPDIGPFNLFIYIAIGLAFLIHLVLWRTPWGLRLRAVGEHPLAADTVGINVAGMRYWGVLLSGLLAGLGGASLSIGFLSQFIGGMTAGYGFIGLAAMIFGRWTPIGALLACLLFGATGALTTLVQMWRLNVPSQFIAMAPYILAMMALAGLVGRATPPAADGVPYEKAH